MRIERFESVWDAIEETPGEAETMRFRSALLMAVRDRSTELGWTRNEAAKRLGVREVCEPTILSMRPGHQPG